MFAEGLGLADIESGRKLDPALRQRIGSITKTMTALSIMALIDEGRLSLDDRIVELLADVPLHGHGSAHYTGRFRARTSGPMPATAFSTITPGGGV